MSANNRKAIRLNAAMAVGAAMAVEVATAARLSETESEGAGPALLHAARR